MNIYVGNISFKADEEGLRQTFGAFGQVTSVAIIKDQATQRSRGFGFVEMPNDPEGQAAIAGLNGKEWLGRPLVVNEARPRESGGAPRSGGGYRPRSGGQDRGGGGGYGQR